MTEDVFGFPADDVSRIRDAVEFIEKTPRHKRRPTGTTNSIAPPLPLCEGELMTDVEPAPPDGKTRATTFSMVLWEPDPTDTGTPQRLIEGQRVNGINTTSKSATAGQRATCMRINGRIEFMFADCP